MEAVPRLPMLSFPRKENTEKSSFTGLKQVNIKCIVPAVPFLCVI